MTESKQIAVLLIGKYQIVQESLKHLIESSDGFSVSCLHSFETANFDDPCVLKSDVAVVYLSADDRVEVVADLLGENPDLRVVMLVDRADLESQARALKLGAVGIVQIEQSPKLLLEAIRQTYAGETWLNQTLLHRILENDKLGKNGSVVNGQGTSPENITAREHEVIKLLAAGMNNKALARQLSLSEATIRHHLSSIYGKIGVEDRLNLVIYAYEHGLVQIPGIPENDKQ